MAIPASHIVNIQPRVITGGSNDLELNGLLLTDNDLISASEMVLSFPSAKAVGDYFGIDSSEYKAADVYFTSYNNKFSAPKALLIARRVAEDAPAWLRSVKNTKSLAEYTEITDGKISLEINGRAVTTNTTSFDEADSFSGVATLLQNALTRIEPTDVQVTYSSLTGAFTITSNTKGETSNVSFASSPTSGTTDLAAFMGFREEDGAIVSAGMDVLTEAEQMDLILTKTQNWVSFTTVDELLDDPNLHFANWASNNYGYLYVAHTVEPTAIIADADADIASIIQTALYDHTTVIYGTLEYACFIMGTIASIPWQRTNGTITLAFKRQAGLAPWVVDERTAAILEKKNCNYFGNFATRNAEFVFLYPGCLSASDYGYIDTYINSVWLNNRLQVALMDGITSVGKVSYTDRGYTMIRAWMMDPLNDAKNNKAIEAGVKLSERQKSEVSSEAGRDISDELFTQGYYLQILDPGAAVRARRESPIISLWYTYGGAVQKIEVASTAIL